MDFGAVRLSRVSSIRRVCLAFVAAIALGANQAPPTPSELYGDLFVEVQEQRIFGDNKTFVDAVPLRAPEQIMADYRAAPPADEEALRAFVLANFSVPGIAPTAPLALREHIRALWPDLVRQPRKEVEGGSLIALPLPYVVPGGRFREIYYWDTYFTMEGLRADGEAVLVDNMIDDFVSLIERFGHVPNGTRTYYVSRSQPPFFALTLDLSENTDPVVIARRLAALRTEYAFWTKGERCATKGSPCERVIIMPDGSILNRYWDGRDTPRDESFAEDRATAAEVEGEPAEKVYRNLRAAAESGWDFSSRWFADGRTLATIRTTDIVPVDLNSLLYAMEMRIARGCREAGDQACADGFAARASARRAAIRKYLWVDGEARYADWSRLENRPIPGLTAATLYPLFTGVATPDEAGKVARTTQERLVAPGGLRTSLVRTGQQWDAPNGWAPLQWIAVMGLERYGHDELARQIASRWIDTVDRTYRETGKMLEKYDVEEQKPGGGGEYPTQDGFGWTNGVASALLEKYPGLDPADAP